MTSLLWKEYREHRFTFFLMTITGILSILITAYFRSIDPELVVLILFIIEGPLFIVLVANQSVHNEVETASFPFLASLPVSRERLWLSKVVFSILFWITLYSTFAVIAWISGATVSSIRMSDMVGWLGSWKAMLLAIPLLAISISLFTTMLPSGFATLINLTLGTIVGAMYFSDLRIFFFSANYYILTFIAIAVCLFASKTAFVRGELMKGRKAALWGIGALFAGIAIGVVVWRGLDILADEYRQPECRDVRDSCFPVGNASGIAFSDQCATSWYDPIQGEKDIRSYFWNSHTGQINQLGNRYTRLIGVSPSGKYYAAQTIHQQGGYVGNPRLIYSSFDGTTHHTVFEGDCDNACFGKNDGLIFKRVTKQSIFAKYPSTAEICRYEPGSGTKVLFSREHSKIDFQYIACSNSLLVFPNLEDRVMISLDDDKQCIASVPNILWKIDETNEETVFQILDKAGRYLKIAKTGDVTVFNKISTDTRFIGSTFEKKSLLLVESSLASQTMYHDYSLITTDFSDNAVKVISTFTNCNIAWWDICLSKSRKWLLVQASYDERMPEVFLINLETGEKKNYKDDSLAAGYVGKYSENKFIVFNSRQKLFVLDPENNERQVILNIDSR